MRQAEGTASDGPTRKPPRRWGIIGLCLAAAVGLALLGILSDTPTPAKVAFWMLSGLLGGFGLYDAIRRVQDDLAERGGPSPETEAAAPRIVHIPHPPNPDFTGREALLGETRRLLHEGYPVALHGLGGVGKTQIAAEFAYRHAADYDLVWWLHAEDAASLTADCEKLARALGLTLADPGEAVARVRRELEGRARWLLIYDNAEGPKALRQALPTRGGHCLITTQCPDWPGLARELEVKGWTPAESLAFFRKVTGQEEGADALADLLGNLPLALAQAAAYIRATGNTLSAYAQSFKTRRAELWPREEPPHGYYATVAVTWNLAMERAAQACPAARDLLNLCAFLAPDDIPRAVLTEHAEALPEALAAAVRGGLALDDALAALRRYSLLTVRGDGWDVHRLVQVVVRDALSDAERAAWAAAAARLVSAAYPGRTYNDPAVWPICARLLPHGLAAAGHAESAAPGGAAVAPAETGCLLNQMGMYARGRLADFGLARDCFQRALRILTARLGPEHPHTRTARASLEGVEAELAARGGPL